MNYKSIQAAIEVYERMSAQEVQDQVKPIIKSYDKEVLAKKLGLSENTLYQYCKTWFVEEGKKPDFTAYIGIMALGMNPEKRIRSRKCRTYQRHSQCKDPEKIKQSLKEYQHRYYLEVTKKKRAEEKRAKEG